MNSYNLIYARSCSYILFMLYKTIFVPSHPHFVPDHTLLYVNVLQNCIYMIGVVGRGRPI